MRCSSSSARKQLLVLLLDFFDQAGRLLARDRLGHLTQRSSVMSWTASRQEFLEHHRGAVRRGLDAEAVHQPPRALDAYAHPRGRLIPAGEHVVEVGNAAAFIGDPDDQPLRAGLAVDEEVHEPLAGVSEGIPDDFRHGRRDARLFREVEAEGLGQLRRPLPGGDDVLIVLKGEGEGVMHHRKGALTVARHFPG